MRPNRGTFIAAATAFAATTAFVACGGSSPGAGGSTIQGQVASANTATLERTRQTWLAWLGEEFLGFARPAYAQARNTSLGGITAIARGQGREVSDLTDSSGNFTMSNAATGDVTMVFRRGSCEGSAPLNAVISNASLTIAHVTFSCPVGSDAGNVGLANISESFAGVMRDDPDNPNDVRLCVRAGNEDANRHISTQGATVRGQEGNPTSFGSLARLDLLQVTGVRDDGAPFLLDTQDVQIIKRGVRDDCSNPF